MEPKAKPKAEAIKVYTLAFSAIYAYNNYINNKKKILNILLKSIHKWKTLLNTTRTLLGTAKDQTRRTEGIQNTSFCISRFFLDKKI